MQLFKNLIWFLILLFCISCDPQKIIEESEIRLNKACKAKIIRMYPDAKIVGGTSYLGSFSKKYYQINGRAFVCYENMTSIELEPLFRGKNEL